MSEQDAAEVSGEIAAGVRVLNWLTQSRHGLEEPADLYTVIGNLELAAQRLPQAFAQMAKWLAKEHAAGRIAHDSGADPAEFVEAVTGALTRAGQDAVVLRAALDSAHQAAASLKTTEGLGRTEIGDIGL